MGRSSSVAFASPSSIAFRMTIVRHYVRIQKQYRKDDGSYENTDYFFPEDLPKLALVAQEAFRFVSLKEGLDATEPPPA